MLLETRIWQALNVFAILVPAFVTLYAAFYTPNPFTQKQLQTTLSLNSDITDSLSKLGDRAKVSIMIDGNPVKISSCLPLDSKTSDR
jgi:hypothetical protein